MASKFKALIDKYKKLSPELKATLWFAICTFLQKGVSLITLPLFTRLLTTEQYGLVTVYNSWYSILSIISTLNLSAGIYVTAYVKFEDDKNKMTSSLLGLSTAVTTAIFVVYLIFSNQINQYTGLTTLLTVFMFFEMYIVPAYNFWSVEQKFEVKYKKLVAVTLIMSVITPIIGVIAVLISEDKGTAKVVSGVLVQIVICGILYLFILRRGKQFFSKKYWKYGLGFSLPLLAHYLALSVLNQSDRIMISNYVGKDKAAIYSVAYSVASIINLLFTSINNSFGPWSVKMIKAKKYDEICKKTRIIIPIIAVMVIALMIFEPEIIAIFATNEYYEAIWVMPPIAVGLYFTFINSIFLRYEFYYEMKYLITISSSISAVTNILLNIIFIPRFGYYAAGYTTMVCYMLLSMFHYFAMKYVSKKYISGQVLFETKYIIKVSLLVIAISALNMILYRYLYIRYFIILLLVIIAIMYRKKIVQYIKRIR